MTHTHEDTPRGRFFLYMPRNYNAMFLFYINDIDSSLMYGPLRARPGQALRIEYLFEVNSVFFFTLIFSSLNINK